MPKPSPILVSLDTDEAHRPRAARLRRAIQVDGHFHLGKAESLSHDMRFQQDGHALNVEIKDFTSDHHSDYVATIINQEGHLYMQVLTGRELQDPLLIVVLGGDSDVSSAISRTVFSRGFQGQEAEDKIIEYASMVENFEANCEGCNIRVWRLKENPYGRMLLRVRKILECGDLSCFRPSPADGERRFVGLSVLIGNGIGPARSQSILEKFNLTLEPKKPDTYLSDCCGIGPKLAKVVQESLNLPHEITTRPKVRKARRRLDDGYES
jgi:hypothetical protein